MAFFGVEERSSILSHVAFILTGSFSTTNDAICKKIIEHGGTIVSTLPVANVKMRLRSGLFHYFQATIVSHTNRNCLPKCSQRVAIMLCGSNASVYKIQCANRLGIANMSEAELDEAITASQLRLPWYLIPDSLEQLLIGKQEPPSTQQQTPPRRTPIATTADFSPIALDDDSEIVLHQEPLPLPLPSLSSATLPSPPTPAPPPPVPIVDQERATASSDQQPVPVVAQLPALEPIIIDDVSPITSVPSSLVTIKTERVELREPRKRTRSKSRVIYQEDDENDTDDSDFEPFSTSTMPEAKKPRVIKREPLPTQTMAPQAPPVIDLDSKDNVFDFKSPVKIEPNDDEPVVVAIRKGTRVKMLTNTVWFVKGRFRQPRKQIDWWIQYEGGTVTHRLSSQVKDSSIGRV
jgi:hypothetical protein